MLMRMLLLTAVLGSGLVFLSGAWPGPFTPPTPDAHSGFVAQAFAIDAAILGSGISANELVEKALEKLDSQRVIWLRTKIRQTMSDPESRFVADGFLQRGPNHCAHLEMAIDSHDGKARLLIVSDGASIATVRAADDAKPIVAVYPFPATDDPNAKEEFLRTMNCSGPAVPLKDILLYLRDGKMQTGRLRDRRVIQIAGELDAAAKQTSASIAVRNCRVYLDAATLWPCQIDWFGLDAFSHWKPIMRVEYADPEINQELSLSECARLFSYQP
jgi:hypothetical protein